MQPDDDALLVDIFVTAERLQSFVEGRDRQEFVDDLQLQFAVQRAIEIIGEAANGLSRAARDCVPDVPWRQMIGMRHRLAHDYDAVNLDIVWDVAVRDLPVLLEALKAHVRPPE